MLISWLSKEQVSFITAVTILNSTDTKKANMQSSRAYMVKKQRVKWAAEDNPLISMTPTLRWSVKVKLLLRMDSDQDTPYQVD